MSKISINFDNEEQYNNFIQSVKNEVLKDMDQKEQYSNIRPPWLYLKEELKLDLDKRREKEGRDIRDTTVAHYNEYYPLIKEVFDLRSISMLTADDLEKARDFKNDLFNLIDEYREGN